MSCVGAPSDTITKTLTSSRKCFRLLFGHGEIKCLGSGRICKAKTTACSTSSAACAGLRNRSKNLDRLVTRYSRSADTVLPNPRQKHSDFKITWFSQFCTDIHAQYLKRTVLLMSIRVQKLFFTCLFVQQHCFFKEGSIFRTITALNLKICYFSDCSKDFIRSHLSQQVGAKSNAAWVELC